ncbi:MAG TPA: hypothetical protein VIY28_11405 [Pseudonocardiaceae bacterium]
MVGVGAPAEAPRVIAITDARTYRAHLVSDAAAAAGRADVGRYVAVCGMVVLAASLTTPDTSFCRACLSAQARGHAPVRSGSGSGTRWGQMARTW